MGSGAEIFQYEMSTRIWTAGCCTKYHNFHRLSLLIARCKIILNWEILRQHNDDIRGAPHLGSYHQHYHPHYHSDQWQYHQHHQPQSDLWPEQDYLLTFWQCQTSFYMSRLVFIVKVKSLAVSYFILPQDSHKIVEPSKVSFCSLWWWH